MRSPGLATRIRCERARCVVLCTPPRLFLKTALRTLAAQTPVVPSISAVQVDFSRSDGHLQARLAPVATVMQFVLAMAPTIDAMPEIQAAVDALLAEGTLHIPLTVDEHGTPIPPTAEQRRTVARDALHTSASSRTCSSMGGAIEFRATRCDKILARFRAVWLTSPVRRLVTVPLVHCVSDALPVPLDDTVSLVPFTPAMKSAFWQPTVFETPWLSAQELASAGCALSVTYMTAAPDDQAGGAGEVAAAERAVRALRLLKTGLVYIGGMYDQLETADLYSPRSHSTLLGDWRPIPRGRCGAVCPSRDARRALRWRPRSDVDYAVGASPLAPSGTRHAHRRSARYMRHL